ncbi:MAG TPA: TPM domain-containing protein [bacterium]|nr:TPM domain-containing protein [bacterium]
MTKILAFLFFWAASMPLALASSFPAPTGFVNDFAKVIPAYQSQQIQTLLTELEQKTGAEVAVVTLDSLNGADIESTATDLFQQWGIGQKKKDNGVLVLAAIQDRKIRIEVGYGLEPILPDGKAGSIIRQYMAPQFKEGDYGSGFLVGTVAIAQIIAQDAGVTLTGQAMDVPLSTGDDPYHQVSFWAFILIFVALWIVLSWAGRRSRGRWGGGYWGGPWIGGGFGGGGGGGFGGFSGGGSGGGGASGGW